MKEKIAPRCGRARFGLGGITECNRTRAECNPCHNQRRPMRKHRPSLVVGNRYGRPMLFGKKGAFQN